MNIKKIFIDGLYNIQNKNFKSNVINLENFFENNKNEILEILNDQIIQAEVSKTINHLQLKEKNYLLSLVYLNLLCEKFPKNNDLRLIISKTYYLCGVYENALFHLNIIPQNKYSLEHYQILINIYSKLENFQKCIEAIKKIRLIENSNSTNTLILINCLRRLRKINEAKLELENLKKFHNDDFEYFYNETLIELLENKFTFVLKKLINFEDKYSHKEIRFHEIYSLVLRKFRKFNEAINQIKIAETLGLKNISSYLYSIYLNLNDFENGYLHLKKATNDRFIEETFLSYNLKNWDFEDLDNSTLFVYYGHGIALGDRIYFYRYLLDIIKRYSGVKIYICSNNHRDHYIFENQNIKLIKFVEIKNFISIENKEFFASLPSIVKIYYEKLSITHLNNFNYLPINLEKQNFWKHELNKIQNNIKIGINWKGDIKYKLDIYRSLSIEMLDPIFKIKNVTYFILNNKINEHEKNFLLKFKNIIIFDNKKFNSEKDNTFSETIEIMRNLDLIISTDTAIAHLASSLNLKTFLMLEHSPFWYWEGDVKKNIYQNINLKYFNQNEPGNWEFVLKQIKSEIKKF
jgi:hypothetical protein